MSGLSATLHGLSGGQRGTRVVVRHLDRDAQHRRHFTGERCQLAERTALLAREHVGQHPLLLGGGTLVDEQCNPPPTIVAVTAMVGDAHHRQPRDIYPIDGALLDMPSQRPGALAIVRFVVEPARTHHVAVAGLDKDPSKVVRHPKPPLRHRVGRQHRLARTPPVITQLARRPKDVTDRPMNETSGVAISIGRNRTSSQRTKGPCGPPPHHDRTLVSRPGRI